MNYNRSEVWMLAESFGAQCCKQIDGQLTHLIAAKVPLFIYHTPPLVY